MPRHSKSDTHTDKSIDTLQSSQEGSNGGGVNVLEKAELFNKTMSDQRKQLSDEFSNEFKQHSKALSRIQTAMLKLGIQPPKYSNLGNVEVMPKKRGPKPRIQMEGEVPVTPVKKKDGRGRKRSSGSVSQVVLAVLKKIAASKTDAKTAREILAAAEKDGKKITPSQLQVSLQGHRRADPARVEMLPGPGGKAKGGQYYATAE